MIREEEIKAGFDCGPESELSKVTLQKPSFDLQTWHRLREWLDPGALFWQGDISSCSDALHRWVLAESRCLVDGPYRTLVQLLTAPEVCFPIRPACSASVNLLFWICGAMLFKYKTLLKSINIKKLCYTVKRIITNFGNALEYNVLLILFHCRYFYWEEIMKFQSGKVSQEWEQWSAGSIRSRITEVKRESKSTQKQQKKLKQTVGVFSHQN